MNYGQIESVGVIYESVESPAYDVLLPYQQLCIYPLARRELTKTQPIDSGIHRSQSSSLLLNAAWVGQSMPLENPNMEEPLASHSTDFVHLQLTGSSDQLRWSLRPYLMGRQISGAEEPILHRGFGIAADAYLGERLAMYVRYNDKGITADFMRPEYLSDEIGGNFKPNQSFFGSEDAFDYSELNGGLSYAWDWGHVGLVKERIVWGSNQFGANIFSGRNPSNVMIDFQMQPTEWLSFKYIHAWLVSEVLDSSRTYLIPGGQREVFTNKNLAANMVAIGPWKNFTLNFGNSIVYSDNGIEPIYLIPLFFFKSADHNNSGAGSNQLGQNAQIFGDISYRNSKGFWFYSTLFIDEVNIGEILDRKSHTNLFSWKVGGRYDMLRNRKYGLQAQLKAEYTRTMPWTYRHQIPSTTFASNQYGLGHYLGENSEEWAAAIVCRPVMRLRLELSHRLAYKGADHQYEIINGNANVTGLEYLSPPTWKRTVSAFSAEYSFTYTLRMHGSVMKSSVEGDIGRVHPYLYGDRTLVDLGFTLGF